MPINPQAAASRVDVAIGSVVWFVVVAAALYLALAVWIGWSELLSSFATLGGAALIAGALVASLNYVLRFARWHHLLLRMSQRVPLADDLRIYIAGLALTATPAKAGETIRSALLLRWRVPVGASLAAFFIDRLTDLIGVLLLAGATGGGTWFWALAVIACAAGQALRWTCSGRTSEAVAAWLEHRHRFPRVARFLRDGVRHYAAAWRPRAFAAYVAMAMVAYGVQGLVFAAFVDLLWTGGNFAQSLRIFATSTLVGAASFIPGGLGAMEIALIAQLDRAGMPLPQATAAAVSLRAVTLWFAILIGLVCLLWHRRGQVTAESR